MVEVFINVDQQSLSLARGARGAQFDWMDDHSCSPVSYPPTLFLFFHPPFVVRLSFGYFSTLFLRPSCLFNSNLQ